MAADARGHEGPVIKPTDLTDAALLAWARATIAAIGSGELTVYPLERGPEDRAGFALRARLAVSAIDRLTHR